MNKRQLIIACDKLWSQIIRLRANYYSEISGKPGVQIGGNEILEAHHILLKPNLHLRYSLENGICITMKEHREDAHGNFEKQYAFKNTIKDLRGENVFENLKILKQDKSEIDLEETKKFLHKTLLELKKSKNHL